jgi:phage N-6-adenine-methyltransferase
METQTLPSTHNRGSTPDVESDEWRTPPHLVRAIERHLGLSFIADMASTRENRICPIHFTKDDDTLSLDSEVLFGRILLEMGDRPWKTGKAVWCNPPYGATGLEPWIAAGREFSKRYGIPWVNLLPASRSEQAWLYAYPPQEYHITYLRGRVPYLRPDGSPGKSPNHPSFVITFPGDHFDIRGGRFSHLDWRA